MRIAILTTSYPRFAEDEAGIFIKRLVAAYSKAGAGGVLVVPFDRSEPIRETQAGFEILRYKYGLFSAGRLAFGAGIKPNLQAHPDLLFQLPLLLIGMVWQAFKCRREYEVMHANWLIAGLAAALVNLLTRKPYLVTLRGEEVLVLQQKKLKPLLKFILRRARQITAVSTSALKLVAEAFPEYSGKITCVPNGVNADVPLPESPENFRKENFRTEANLTDAPIYLLFAGTLIPRKRIDALIKLLVQPGLEQAVLVLCGRLENDAYVTEVKKQANELGCQKRVFFQGAVPPGRMACYYALADFYVTASGFEGRPNSVLEALAAGKIVCASDIPAHREIIEHGRNGFLFDPPRMDVLAGFVSNITADPDLRRRISAAAKESVKNLSWERCAQNYLQLLKS